MNNNNFGKKYEISQSSVDQKYRVYEWMTLSDVTNEEERDSYKKWVCVGIANDMKECKEIVEAREKNSKKE